MLRTDYSIQSSNTPAKDSLAQNRANKIPELQRGMIFRVYYTDDPLNPTKKSQNPQVVYDVILISGPLQGQIIPNVRVAPKIGGQYNFEELIYRKPTKPFSGKGSVPFNKQDGDVVYLQFTDGNLSSPVIMGGGEHPLDTSNTGSTKSQGPRWVTEYNGVRTEINKDGEYTLTRKGGAYDSTKGFFKPAASGNEAQLKFTKNKATLSAKTGGVTVTLDGDGKKASVAAGAISVTVEETSKKVTITSGSATIVVDSTSNKVTVTAGSASIEIDGASGKISLSGDQVDIGAAASSLAMLGTEFLTWATTHTHLCAAPASPSGPPIAPPPSSSLSGTVKIQA